MATSPSGSVDVRARALKLLRRPIVFLSLVLVIGFWLMMRHFEANRLAYERSPKGREAAARAAEQDEIESAQRMVRMQLRDPSSATFLGGVRHGQRGVCGFVNSRNGFGGMSGDQSYAVIGPRVLINDQGSQAREEIGTFCYG